MPWLSARLRGVLAVFVLSCTPWASAARAPEQCVPIRWTGGSLELAWRTHTKTFPTDSSVRDALARWYEPETLSLLEDSPVNCLLVTWSAPADVAVEIQQKRLVKIYAEAAHKHGLDVYGIIYAAGDASKIAADSATASLDGLVLDGDFPAEFPAALRKAAGSMLVIEIAKDPAEWRRKPSPIVAVAGVAPSGRNLSEMGIRGAPSSQPWIESNVWLARSFALGSATCRRAMWINSQLENPSVIDYERAVADASAAGGRWIISLDDTLRAKLHAHDTLAVETWRRLSSYLRFSDTHKAWCGLAPYGNVGFVLDTTTQTDVADEYQKLATRRQVPYQLISRSEFNADAITKFHAIVATELDPPSETERKMLREFAQNGGIVFAGPSWGGGATKEPFAELPAGKGSVIVYKDPDPEAVAHDLKELLSDDDMGMVPFNVPSVITSVSVGTHGRPLLVQLVNYFDRPVEAITLRLSGNFHSARLETPEGAPMDLPVKNEEGRTEVTIPKLLLWGAVLLE